MEKKILATVGEKEITNLDVEKLAFLILLN